MNTLTISKSNFLQNSANIDSGSISSLNTGTTISETTFQRNKAKTGDAGALLLDCSTLSTIACDYRFTDVEFHHNSAKNNGGAVKYTFYKPVEVEVDYEQNSAIYG